MKAVGLFIVGLLLAGCSTEWDYWRAKVDRQLSNQQAEINELKIECLDRRDNPKEIKREPYSYEGPFVKRLD